MRHIDPYEKRAEDYASCRPPYAPEAFDALADITGLDASWMVADIASGTGNVTETLLTRVDTVYAVEPSDEMRHVAERKLGCHKGFFSLNATAEATGLPSECVDLIMVGQGLHWFDAH